MHKPPGRAQWTRSVDFTPNDAWNQATHLRLKISSIKTANESGKLPALLWICDSLIRVGMLEPCFGMRYTSIQHTDVPKHEVPQSLRSLPMSLKFKIQCLVSKHIISRYDVTDELISVIQSALEQNISEKSVCSILQSLENANHRRFDVAQCISKAVASHKYSQLKGPTDNSSYVLIPHVTVTPLRIWCEGPVAEISNRVIRAFPEHRDRFIRVSFKDEDGKTSIKGAGRALIRDRILRLLDHGFELDIVGLKYSWLVFSSGQLRGHKTWFFSENQDLTCNQIRSWMGSFDRIFNVALYSSRLGQALSSTYQTIDIAAEEMVKVPDVRRNGYNFSDGVGTISLELAREVAQRLPLKNKEKPPSAFQIRLGGIKGVVSVDPRLQGRLMNIRPSMDKFPSPHSNMEVISWAKSIPAHLNRQLILILSDLGVPDQVFIDAQETALQRISAVKKLGESASAEAANMQIDLLESTWRVKNKPDSLPARAIRMMRAGFSPESEPYLFSMYL
jgi:RNA-dependent RNA polymerase